MTTDVPSPDIPMPDLTTLGARVDADPRLIHRGRRLNVTFLLEIGGDAHLVDVRDGRITVREGPFLFPSWQFALRAPADAWAAFWSEPPAPGTHDLFALLKRGDLRIEGDLHPFMANLQWFKDVLTTMRGAR